MPDGLHHLADSRDVVTPDIVNSDVKIFGDGSKTWQTNAQLTNLVTASAT